MPRVLVLCLLAILSVSPLARAATGADIEAPFDAGGFEPAEIRVLQAALAASGDYAGVLDGRWSDDGAAALDVWSAREFGAAPLAGHAAAAVAGFLDAARDDGWREVPLADLGLALALPLARLSQPVDEAGGTRQWTTDGSFAVLTHRFDRADATAWHDTAASLAAGRIETRRGPDRLVTTGTLADGRAFFTRSDLIAGAWATVYLTAEPSAEGALRLAAASLHAGRPEGFDLPADGRLARLVDSAARLVQAATPAPAGQVATPARFDAEITALPPSGDGDADGAEAVGGTGTAFYVGPQLLLTAAHVVAGCTTPSLADGTPLETVAADEGLDVAVLRAPRQAPHWLAFAEGRMRLGQRVYAIGFPYYSIAGTSLTLTGGNVSALAGIDDDARYFSFSAPVQPGNSGGPLLDARGRVLGLVVARLSEDYIVEATGSLPQNVNYALREAELDTFLSRAGIAAETGGLGRFDPDDGVPDGVEDAIVPIVCH
ncbi:MAG: serine protease [Amaricoccus sp.]|uniref:S1C family serine protease n=1 Tax=Amaricoccus sp. TaxID=1872485 RepID=UPI0039E3F172